jgi:hypothetical protein
VTFEARPLIYSGNTKISAGELVYKWTVDDAVLENQSGYGKNVIRFAGPILGTAVNVDVMVTDPLTNTTARNSVTLNPISPLVVFYENNPRYGIIFENSINDGVNLAGEEMSIIAAPFYMNIKDPISYNWKMNGKFAPEVTGLSATFRKPEEVSGSTLLSLKAENQKKILQSTENGFRINYKNE